MKKILAILVLIFVQCTPPTPKPKNLISKEKMAAVLVDFAIYDQAYHVTNTSDLESSSLFVLKKNKIKSKDFKESYQYYLTNGDDLEDIYDLAEENILKKDPKLKDFIKKKEKGNPSITEKLTK